MATDFQTSDPAEEALKKEFDLVVQSLVDNVRETASETVERASAGMQRVAEDLRSTSGAIEQTAKEARSSIATVRDNTRAVEALKKDLRDLEPRLDALQSEVTRVNGSVAGVQRLLEKVEGMLVRFDAARQQQFAHLEARLKSATWTSALLGMGTVGLFGLLTAALLLLRR